MLFYGLVTLAFAETGAVDSAIGYPVGGSSRLEWDEVPEALSCFEANLSDQVGLDEPFEVIASNSCAFVVEVRQVGCVEDDLTADHDGCARLELQAGGADREGLPFVGGDEDVVDLEWFDPAAPDVKATSTWGVWVDLEGGGGSGDSCGCTSAGGLSLSVVLGLVGLVFVGLRR